MNGSTPVPPSRRAVLRAAGGITIGLPLLPSLARAAVPPPRRLVVMFQADGIDHTRFWPKVKPGPLAAGALMGSGLAPLDRFRDKLLIPRGLHGSPRGFGRDGINVNDHTLGTQTRLTCAGLGRGPSIDQVVAAALNPAGAPPLTLGVGRRDGGAQHALSFQANGRPAPREDSPFRLFQSLTGLSTADTGTQERLQARRQSVLDTVKEQFDRLLSRPRLGNADRQVLDMHFSSIRDLEVRTGESCKTDMQLETEVQGSANLDISKDDNFPTYARLQVELLCLALACGQNHVATLMMGGGSSDIVFRWLGHTRGHHLISHRIESWERMGPLNDALERLHEIDIWHAEQFALMCERLSAYQEGDATALDNSVLLWVNELSEGKMHHFRDLPFVVAGSAGGRLKQGRYEWLTKFADPLANADRTRVEDAPHNKLFTTILNALDVRQAGGQPFEKFGSFGLAGTYDSLLA
jgi:hypothetical protein